MSAIINRLPFARTLRTRIAGNAPEEMPIEIGNVFRELVSLARPFHDGRCLAGVPLEKVVKPMMSRSQSATFRRTVLSFSADATTESPVANGRYRARDFERSPEAER